MAHQIDTATNLEDLFSRIVNFLTSDPQLVANGQNWAVNRIHRDGIASYTSNMTEQTAIANRKINHSFRYDSRSLNTDSLQSSGGYTLCGNYVAGDSFVRMELRQAQQVDKIALRSCSVFASGSNLSLMIGNFKLQWSDDDISWTDALVVDSDPSYQFNEIKEFSVAAPTGAHLYWRVIIDSVNNGVIGGGSCGWRSLLLFSGDEVVNHFGSEVLFQAPGNSGTDEIYTGIRSEYDAANDWYNLFLNGYTGYDPEIPDFFEQPGALLGFGNSALMEVPMIPCSNDLMPYWFSATGRSFKIGLKVSTSFEGGYLGFISPYATPTQYPYPLAVGGSLTPFTGRAADWRHSYNNYRHSVFPTPAGSTASEQDASTFYICLPDGQWRSMGGRFSSSNPNLISRLTASNFPPFDRLSGSAAAMWPNCVHSTSYGNGNLPFREVLGGGYALLPLIAIQVTPEPAVLGELEDVYSISGFNNSAENTTEFGGVNHIILQNAFRNESQEYWAIALN